MEMFANASEKLNKAKKKIRLELYGFECQYADCNNILNVVTSADGVFV